jgi:Transposase IS66 family
MLKSMRIEIPEIPVAERTPLVEALLVIIDLQQQRLCQVEETVQQLRDEIAILKGQKPRPQIAPSVLDKPPAATPPPEQKRPGSDKRSKNAQLVIHHTQWLDVPDAPAGSIHIGYESFVVQELHIEARATRYWRQRVQTPDGGTLLAPLPPEVLSGRHFGPGLNAFVLHQHHHNGVTQPLLLEQLHEWGIDISTGQIHRLLTEEVEIFHQEKDELLPVGLSVSSYIGVDDTGARHQGHNGYCTAISNDLFAFFQSTDSKSRINFLQVLRGASTVYAINETARAYWKEQGLSASAIENLSGGPSSFADEAAWQAWLAQAGLAAERLVRIATEGALLGCLIEQGVSPHLLVLSDGAGQFDVLVHASCWVHAERPLTRLIPHGEEHRLAIARVQIVLWELYQDLKSYRQRPDAGSKRVLESRFDELVGGKSGYPSIDGVLKEMRQHKADLLRILDHPEVPLHNNGTESDIREYVKKRKISGGTRSDAGRRCRDTFSSLKKTCRKLGVSFWSYLKDRLGRLARVPRLSELIRQRAAEKSAGKVVAAPV